MKRLLTLLLLASLALFTACDGNSIPEADAETTAAANAIGAVVFAVAGDASDEVFAELGASPGISAPGTTTLSSYPNVTVDYSYSSGTVTTVNLDITFDNYVHSDGTTIDGTVSYYMEGSQATGSFECTFTGNLTSVYQGTTYTLRYNVIISLSSSGMTISGTVIANGGKVTVNETISF